MKTQIGIWRRICEARNSWSRGEWITNGDNVRSLARPSNLDFICRVVWLEWNRIANPSNCYILESLLWLKTKNVVLYHCAFLFTFIPYILRYLYHMLSCTLYIIIFVLILGTHLYDNMLVAVVELHLIQMLCIIMLYSQVRVFKILAMWS